MSLSQLFEIGFSCSRWSKLQVISKREVNLSKGNAQAHSHDFIVICIISVPYVSASFIEGNDWKWK
jgi:hypothetical protein